MSWIQTYSGVQFWPLDPKAADVRLEDIAHALANTCRFTGHCRVFYSVAQHSVLVAKEMHRQGFKGTAVRAALFHDAAEAYLPDIARPIKSAWKEFGLIEATLLSTIYEALDIQGPSAGERAAIKDCDDALLATEARDLLGPPPAEWVQLPPPLTTTITPWSPIDSKRLFLKADDEAKGTCPTCGADVCDKCGECSTAHKDDLVDCTCPGTPDNPRPSECSQGGERRG